MFLKVELQQGSTQDLLAGRFHRETFTEKDVWRQHVFLKNVNLFKSLVFFVVTSYMVNCVRRSGSVPLLFMCLRMTASIPSSSSLSVTS